MPRPAILPLESVPSAGETEVPLLCPLAPNSRFGIAPPEDTRIPTELVAEVCAECGAALTKFGDSLRRIMWRIELIAFAAFIALFNLPLLAGGFSTQFIFHPDSVRAGEWWRVLTHPFVHVSCYHLALDSLAFFLAYTELHHRRFLERLAIVAAAGTGSLLVALAASPLIATHGLCGLSGIAHGLTAAVSLEMLRRSNDRVSQWSGLLCFVGVTGKSLFELITGHVLFASWHLGWLGTPIAACHAGGVLGAIAVWLFFRHWPRLNKREEQATGKSPEPAGWKACATT